MAHQPQGTLLEWDFGGLVRAKVSAGNFIERDGISNIISICFIEGKQIVGGIPDSIFAEIISEIIPIWTAAVPKPVNTGRDVEGVKTAGPGYV